MKPIAILFAALMAPLLQASETRALTVVNDTSSAVNQLFVAGGRGGGLRAKVSGIIGPADDDRDRLDTKMLPRGGSIALTLKGDRCRYDIRAVLEDGRVYVGDDVDVCANPRWAISQGTRR